MYAISLIPLEIPYFDFQSLAFFWNSPLVERDRILFYVIMVLREVNQAQFELFSKIF